LADFRNSGKVESKCKDLSTQSPSHVASSADFPDCCLSAILQTCGAVAAATDYAAFFAGFRSHDTAETRPSRRSSNCSNSSPTESPKARADIGTRL
jgi:hypothetical protein